MNFADDWKPNSGNISRRLITKPNIVENLHNKGSHQHFCYVGGHSYECGEDCECICGLPMNGYDHSDCPVELRPCPESESHQEQPMSEEEGLVEIKFPAGWQHAAPPQCHCGCADADMSEVVGWCLRCDHVYVNYSPKLQDQHFAYHCPGAPQTSKDAALARLAKRGT